MKKILLFVVSFVFIFSVSAFAYVDDGNPLNDGSISQPVVIEKTDLTELIESIKDLKPVEDNSDIVDNSPIQLDVKASPVTPSSSNGFHQVMIRLLGNYEPITVDYTYYQGSSSYQYHEITTAPDWSWISSAAIFGLVIFCTFRFIGGIFKND